MQMHMTRSNILVKLDRFPEKPNEGGKIFQPDIAQERPFWGKVCAVGPGHYTKKGKYVPTELTVGDKVCLPWEEGREFKIKDRIYMIIPESTVMAVSK